MSPPRMVDILVVDGAWQLDAGGQPRLTEGVPCIAQDVQHTLMASGLTRKLIGERNPTRRADVLTAMELLLEADVRLVPGTIAILETHPGQIALTAHTDDAGQIEVTL